VHAQVATLQALLEGVDLPASRDELIRYARLHDSEGLATLLERLPEREYDRIDEVAETLAPVQPQRTRQTPLPHEESDLPPGGDDYVKAHSTPGRVRLDAPSDNPPQKAIEQQSRTQSAQKKRQDELLGGEGR
jgi:Protein of unknown function (DUF2795)